MQSIIPVEIPVQNSGAKSAIQSTFLDESYPAQKGSVRQHFAQHDISPISAAHQSRGGAFMAAAWISLCLTLCLCLAGCGGGFPSLSFSALTASANVLDSRQSVTYATTGTGNLEVAWSLTGSSCSGSTCGLLTATGNGTGIYTAPVGVATPMMVTITGTTLTGDTQSVTLTVNPDPSLSGSLPVGVVGSPYAAKLVPNGGTGAVRVSLYTGSLPAGLTLDSNTNTISGTPTTTGTSVFALAVTDSAPTPYTSHPTITIVVTAAGVNTLQLAAGVPPVGYVGKSYSTGLTASGGTPPYTYNITSGSLPAGLTLAASTGIISGTPTVAGAPLFAAQVQDSQGSISSLVLSITVLSSLSITTGTLPNGTVGTAYSATIGVTGGTSPYTCSLASGTLPAGLSLGAGCVVSGTPTSAGTVNLTVKATDSSNPVLTTTGPVSLTISPAGLTISSGTLPAGTVGTPYSSTVGVTGGTSPYSCTIAAGALPLGLSMGANCLVSGTPTTAGTATMNIKATDSGNPMLSTSRTVLLTINPSALAIIPGNLPDGTVGVSYNAMIPVTGGTSPYSCTITSGMLPAGLTLGAGCVVSGTPSSAVTVTLGVQATDSGNPAQSATGAVTLTIYPAALAVTPTKLANGTVGVPYSSTIPVTGGTPPYSCDIISGVLPAGLSLGPNCLVSGTPAAAAAVTLLVRATDSSSSKSDGSRPSQTGIGTVGLTIDPADLTLSTGTLPVGTVGVAYSSTIGVTGGTPPYSCAIASGSLPSGLTLGANCLVSGVPTVAGTVNLSVTAIDSAPSVATATGNVAITINPAALVITTGTLPNGAVGIPYAATIPVAGGLAPYICTITSGTLPLGLTLGPNCLVSGIPLVPGTASLGVQATDSSNPAQTVNGTLSLTINPANLFVTGGVLPVGQVGTPYSATIPVVGGTAPYSCVITSGTLPAGLGLGPNCVISGTPLVAGVVALGVQATDSGNPAQTAGGVVALTISPASLIVTGGVLPVGTVGEAYSATIPVLGGTAPYSCSIMSGTLPAGLTLGANCVISGTPTVAAVVTLGVTATDTSNPAQTASGSVVLTVLPSTLIVTGGVLPVGMVGTPYAATIPVAGGTSPYSCSITSGTLPAGITLGANCLISGNPTAAGTVTLGVKATDSSSTPQSANGTVVLTINPSTLIVAGGSMPIGTVGTPYSATIPVAGGTPTYTCTITSGALPAGLTLGANCLVTGTPTTAENVTVGVRAIDSSNPAQTANGTASFTINPAALIVTGGVLPAGVVGTPYSATIPVIGGTAPYSCSITSGTLQAGLTLGANCVVSGTPTAAGVSTLGIKATDNGGQTANGVAVLTVTPATLILTGGLLPVGTVGTPYSATIPVLGGTAPYSCSITSGTLPDGLTLGANCLISGTPSVSGTVTLGVKVTDSESPAQTANGTVVLTINPATLILTGGVLPVGTVGTAYSATIPVSGGTAPYSCIITSGTLPAGLTLGAGCVISGTPTAAGVVTLGVKATDSESTPQTATGTVVLTVAPATLILTGGVLPIGTVGTAYTATIPVLGGTAPYNCTITSGTLPAGLTLGAGCVISGTPTTATVVTLGVKATDSESTPQSANGSVVLTINPAALIVTGGVMPVGVVGTPYSSTIPVIGGTAPYSCTITSGTLPAGLTLGASCVISGTPTAPAVVTLGVKATDSGSQTANGTIVLTVTPATLILTGGVLPAGMVDTAYTATIPVLGGTSPYSCSITSGTLPAGLTLGAGCVISGTPTAAGVVTLGIKVTDSESTPQTANGTVVLTITPSTLVLTGGVLPVGTVGSAYTATIPVLGGTSPYSCTITSGTLPAGLTLGANCAISGTPTVAGVTTLGVKVTDSGSTPQTANGTVVLTITPATLILTGGALPPGVVGTAYSATIPVLGGTSPYSCTITSGTLPAGLTLGANCLVSGTPTAAGVTTLGVKVTDSGGTPQTSNGTVVLTITPAALIVTGGVMPVGMVGTPYSSTIPVIGGTAPYSCTITSGTLPAGLTLGANCVISGTPTAPAVVTLGVKATDSGSQTANGTVVLTVTPATLILSAGVLPIGTVGIAYTGTIPVLGGTAPYTCTIISGTLPAGLTMGAGCVVSGTPTAAAVSTLGIHVVDSGSPAQSTDGVVVLTITPAALIISVSLLPNGTVGMPYSQPISITGGVAPYSCSITAGTLPAGLTLGAGCVVSGTPTTAALLDALTIKVTDSETTPQTATGVVTLTINAAALTVTSGALPSGQAGVAYSATIPVMGGTPPYTCVISSLNLPPGLTVGSGCVISGTPLLTSSVTLSVLATDSALATATGTETLAISAAAPLTLTGTLPNATVGTAYSQTLTASGGVGPYTYAVTTGTLPTGLTLNATTGVVSGTPTVVGGSSFTVTASDTELPPQTATLSKTMMVNCAPTPYDGQLSGPYAFLFQGYDTVLVGTLAYQTATVGSFTADGNGSLTSGELDSNHQTSTPTGATVPTSNLVGSYTVASDGTGTVVVTTLNSDGTVAANNTFSISLKAPVAPATVSKSGTMAEADTGLLTGQRGNGSLQLQDTTSYASGLTGSYAFGMQGDIVCVPACSVNLQAGPAATVGQITIGTGGTLAGLADTNLASSNYPTATLAGTYGSADVNGRVQMSVNNPNIPNASYPLDYAVYMIDAYHAFVMSTDKHSAYTLLAGNMTAQTGTFSNSSFSGQYVGYENAATNPGLLGTTLSNVLNLSTATIFQGTANGAGGCTTNYVDQGGTSALVSSLTGLGGNSNLLTDLLGTYASTGTSVCTVATSGRAVLNYPAPSNVLTGLLGLLGVTATAPAPRVAYLTNTNTGYFLETGYAGLGTLERQLGQPFSLATLNGTYTYGTTPAVTAVTLNASGTFTANGTGTINYNLNEDVAVGGQNVVTPNVTGSGTYVLADGPNGRYTFGTDVIYAITPTRFVLVDKSALNTSPSVSLLY